MENRTMGIVATVITSLCCGCLSLFACTFGAATLINGSMDLNGESVSVPSIGSISLICLSVVLIAIPVVVGFLTLRKKPATAPVVSDLGGPIPPAS